MKEKISVIVSAYRASDYIKECIDSIASQSYFESFDGYEILLGIDGCLDTLNTVTKFMDSIKNLRVLYSSKNFGPYLMFNTLFNISEGHIISVFGADDIMLPDFIEHSVSLISKNSFVISRGSNFIGEKSNVTRTYNPDGVITLNRPDLIAVNGFAGWRCGADSDLKIRLKLNGLSPILSNKTTFLRRIHNASLTSNRKYGMNSEYRSTVRTLAKSRKEPKLPDFQYLKKYKMIK